MRAAHSRRPPAGPRAPRRGARHARRLEVGDQNCLVQDLPLCRFDCAIGPFEVTEQRVVEHFLSSARWVAPGPAARLSKLQLGCRQRVPQASASCTGTFAYPPNLHGIGGGEKKGARGRPSRRGIKRVSATVTSPHAAVPPIRHSSRIHSRVSAMATDSAAQKALSIATGTTALAASSMRGGAKWFYVSPDPNRVSGPATSAVSG